MTDEAEELAPEVFVKAGSLYSMPLARDEAEQLLGSETTRATVI